MNKTKQCKGCGKPEHEGISEYCNNGEHRNCNAELQLCVCSCHTKQCNHEHFSRVCNTCGVDLVHQALAEDRDRMRERVGELTIYRNNKGVTEIEENTGYYKASEIDETLSSLDKPLTDKK